MASIEDRWYHTRPGPDGKKARKSRHGTGKRWKVYYTDPDGRRRTESFDRRVDAERFRTTVEADILRGVFIDPDAGNITLSKYALETWLPAQTFSPSTRERVESRLRLHILPDIGGGRGLGSYSLSQLARSPSVIQAWLRGLQAKEERPLAPSHIRLVLQTLSTILNAAVADDRMTRNPCKVKGMVKPPKPDERRIVPWEAARISAIRAALPYRYQAVADVGKGSGLRQGEVFGLSPDDIDWLRKIIHVRRQVKIVGGRRVFAPPKFGKDRDVPLSAALALRLSAHLKVFPAAEVTLPWQKPGGKPVTVSLMFTKDDEGAIWRNDFNRYTWHPALKAAGLAPGRENGFHQLRHHFASVVQVSRVASGASFGSLREHALPAAQHVALRRPRPAGPPRGYGDLGLHRPPGSDATMMQLTPLRGAHHHCACWHRDASGNSRLHRVPHRLTRRAAPGRHRSCAGRAGPRTIGGATRRTWHPAALVAPDASPPPETDVRAAASSPVSHAARRPADVPRTWPPGIPVADRRTLLAWTCDTAGQIRTRNHQPGE